MRDDETKPRWTFLFDGKTPAGPNGGVEWSADLSYIERVAGYFKNSVVVDADELVLNWEAQAGSWE